MLLLDVMALLLLNCVYAVKMVSLSFYFEGTLITKVIPSAQTLQGHISTFSCLLCDTVATAHTHKPLTGPPHNSF